MYQKEEEDLQRTLDKHIANGAEEWDVKNTVRVCDFVEGPRARGGSPPTRPLLPLLAALLPPLLLHSSGRRLSRRPTDRSPPLPPPRCAPRFPVRLFVTPRPLRHAARSSSSFRSVNVFAHR